MPRWAYWVMWVVVVGCLVFIAMGCVSVEGPCQLEIDRQPEHALAKVQCEAGGMVSVFAPAHSLEVAAPMKEGP